MNVEPVQALRSADALVRAVLRTSCCVACLLVTMGAFSGCEQKAKEATEAEKQPEAASRVKHGTNDEVTITLDAATRKVMGLETSPLPKAQLSPEAKAYGHVLDPSPLTTMVADLQTAQAAAAASDAELKRLQTLAAQHNASERALQSAQAAAVRDNTQVQAIRLRLLAAWGSPIAKRQDLPVLVRDLSALAAALIQLNVSAGEILPGSPTGARVLTLAEPTKPIGAELLGAAPVTDPQMQNRGFVVMVKPNTPQLAPGQSVSGYLTFSGEPQKGAAVPLAAVVQFNGATWVYLQTDDDTFRRVEVKLGPPLDNGLFVREGLSPGDKVVIVGAQQLLSEELKAQGGE